mgnify:CR=1 FL=1
MVLMLDGVGFNRISIALGEVCCAFGIKRLCPRINLRPALGRSDGLRNLACGGGGIGPNAQRDREKAANSGGFQLYLNDRRIAVDVVIGIERRIKAKARAKCQNNVRLFHQPWWFRKVHVKHHRFKGTRSEAFGFAHPVETSANVVALLAGPLLVSTHVVTLWLWLIFRLWETVDAHSGFVLPTSPWAAKHCWHHRYIHGCFGSFFGFWDWLMGTDKGYREWKAEQQAKTEAAST